MRELEQRAGSCQAALRVSLGCRVNMEILTGGWRRWRVFQIRIAWAADLDSSHGVLRVTGLTPVLALVG